MIKKTPNFSKILTNYKIKIQYGTYCNKYFTTKFNYVRHDEYNCKIKKQQNNDKEDIFHYLMNQLEKQNEQFDKQNEKISKIEKQNIELQEKINKLRII